MPGGFLLYHLAAPPGADAGTCPCRLVLPPEAACPVGEAVEGCCCCDGVAAHRLLQQGWQREARLLQDQEFVGVPAVNVHVACKVAAQVPGCTVLPGMQWVRRVQAGAVDRAAGHKAWLAAASW